MDSSPAHRANKEILSALKPFAREIPSRTWWHVASTLLPLGLFLTAAALLPWWPLRALCSVAAGLVMVRSFILYHDFLHGSILRNSKPAKVLMTALGVLMLTPPRSWRETHNYHHAHVGRIGAAGDESPEAITTDIGSFPLLSTEMWPQASRTQRFRYRFVRHPLTIACAYLTVFLISICLRPLVRNPRKHWPSALFFIGHFTYLAALLWAGGWPMLLFVGVLPLSIAAATGAYLFYAQHSFPGVHVFTPDEWNFVQASMETASYLKTGRFMRWITGCIGYHHVHHLNSNIPFYRLPEAMAAIPELQHPITTRLRFRDIAGCFRANLWDPDSHRMVSYRDAAVMAAG